MRRIPLNVLLITLLSATTCLSIFWAGNLIFSAFSRNLWIDYIRTVEQQVRFVFDDLSLSKDSTWSPGWILRSVKRPIYVPADYRLAQEEYAERLAEDFDSVYLYDAQGKLIIKHAYGKQASPACPDPDTFALLRKRFAEFRSSGGPDGPRPQQSSFSGGRASQRIIYGPASIMGPLYDYGLHCHSCNFWSYVDLRSIGKSRNAQIGSRVRADAAPEMCAHKEHSAPQGGLCRNCISCRTAGAQKETLAESCHEEAAAPAAGGGEVFSPPGFLRVSYEMANERQVFVAPLCREDELAGYVMLVSSWAEMDQILHEFATQLAVINVLVAVLMSIIAILVSHWLLRPLRQVVATAREVAKGNLQARTGMQNGRNEFYIVGHSLDTMVGTVEDALAEQRRFVGDASHELKTPIASLMAAAQVLKIVNGQLCRDPQIDKSLQTMDRELDRMAELVHDLLLLSLSTEMPRPVSMDPISAAELIEGACQASLCSVMNRQVEKKLPGDVWLLGNKRMLERALRNVIDNALRYTPADKKVTVSFKHTDGMVCIEVDDEGCGIKAECLEHIGKRFYRTDSGRDRKQGGTGLGLAITKAVMESHGGRFEITSQEGKGTQVKLYLPLPSTEEAGEPKPEQP